jgi:hypothetical protein
VCEYFAIRAAEGKALPLDAVSQHLFRLDLHEHVGAGTWLTGDATGNMLITAEADGSGRSAAAPGDPVVSLDVISWCPFSGRTSGWPDEATLRAQETLRQSLAQALGWTVVEHDDPTY